MKIRWKWIILIVVVAAVAAGVLRALGARNAQKAALAQQQTLQTTVMEVRARDVATAQTVQLTTVLPLSGPIRAVQSAFVKARVAGELQGLTVREGDAVKAGQVLARIDATEAQARLRQAQQQAESAKAQVDIARRSDDNNRSLVEQGFISKTALNTSTASLAAAEATYRAAQAAAEVASKSLEDTVLRAPISGQVAQRLAQSGERVSVDARIVEIVDLSQLEIEVSLSAADSLRVKAGQTAQMRVEGADQAFNARVARVSPSASSASRAVLAYLSVDKGSSAQQMLRQGLFTQGQLALGTVQALTVPLDAVRVDKPLPYVQVVAEGKVRHQTVVMGSQGELDGETRVQIDGVPQGTQVLRGAVGALREGTSLRVAAGTANGTGTSAGTDGTATSGK